MNKKTLMVQGCTSDAGKTVMVAGLCRLLARQQASVVPFKPQNMALNSAVTVDGGEIGRAQAVQAQACYLEPHTDMNPILLKPSSDTGAQVIVHGHPIDAMEATRYHDYKKVAMQAVLESHERLSQEYEHIIVEGAGSPAEINLREGDIANMGFAEAVDCPVIIVADIDKGGVFAHLVGTLDLLSESEQERVIGFIINRFRGDISLLEPGVEWLEKRTNKPVLGVIPYLQDFFLDAEDAIAAAQRFSENADEQVLNIVVPVLPRISNHTDFDALRLHPQVNLQFTSIQQACPKADLIILPGSKNVLEDLQALQATGWQEQLNQHLRYGGKLMGICGGYQMLGHTLKDPEHIESQLQQHQGFGFFNAHTTLKPEKQLKRVKAQTQTSALPKTTFSGYEIHCGITESLDQHTHTFAHIQTAQGEKADGMVSDDNQIIGTYIHGLFDEAQACDALLKWAGLKQGQAIHINDIREQQLERLADCLEENLHASFLQSLHNR